MHLIGERNWSYPQWADKITPRASIEGGPVGTAPVALADLTSSR